MDEHELYSNIFTCSISGEILYFCLLICMFLSIWPRDSLLCFSFRSGNGSTSKHYISVQNVCAHIDLQCKWLN